ncbi:MAG: hypothetical protein Q9166_006123 [cf. Caloplaca sp. 2 TL-2023]
MTLDRPTRNANVRTSTTASTSKSTGRGTHTPSGVRTPVSSTTPAFRREVQDASQNASATDGKEGVATPVKTLLGSNITPRSGSRKARVESASSTPRRTPESTPPTARPVSMIEGRDWPSREPKKAPGPGIKNGHVSRPGARSVSSDVQYSVRFSPADSSRDRGARTTSPEHLPKFFHANDAKPRPSTRPQSQSPSLQPKLSGTQHINGVSKIDASGSSASPDSGDEHPKFMYANRIHEATTPPPRFANGIVSGRPPLQTIFSSYQTPTSPAQRPPSPLKEEVVPMSRMSSLSKPSPRRHTRLVSNGSNDIRAPDALVKGQADVSRRSSLISPGRRISRPQSPVTANFGYTRSRRSSFALSDSGRDPAPLIPPESVTAEPPQNEAATTASPEPIPSLSPSRPAPGQSKLDHLNELAANARRERKVLDLEISNSSLLAINRTLETEMRKQKAELRRLRRLRSSGRFPFSTHSASSRFSVPSTTDDLSPTSSADEDELDDDRFSNVSSGTSDDTSFPESNFSPTIRNSSVPMPKGRRSRSFKVDLAGQRVLLLDSQRLNQALKRCLGRTDELIADGKKALEYKVNTGDPVNLGPRVLTPDEREGVLEMGRGLLSPGLDEGLDDPWDRVRAAGDAWNLSGSDDLGRQKSELPVHVEDSQRDDDPEPHRQNNEHVLYNKPKEEPGLGISSTQQDVSEADAQDYVDAFHEDPIVDMEANVTALEDALEVTAITTDESVRHEPRVPNNLEIPYEDPGIDTGGEISAVENDGAPEEDDVDLSTDQSLAVDIETGIAKPADGSSHVESSDVESTTSEEPAVSSPGKGLGGFLRMVGGSWGV